MRVEEFYIKLERFLVTKLEKGVREVRPPGAAKTPLGHGRI